MKKEKAKKDKWVRIPEWHENEKKWKKELLEVCKKNEMLSPYDNVAESLYFMAERARMVHVDDKWVKKQVYIYGPLLDRVCVELADTSDQQKWEKSFYIPTFAGYKYDVDEQEANYKKHIDKMKKRESYRAKGGLKEIFTVNIDKKYFRYVTFGDSYNYKIKNGILFIYNGKEVVKILKKWDDVRISYRDEWDNDE